MRFRVTFVDQPDGSNIASVGQYVQFHSSAAAKAALGDEFEPMVARLCNEHAEMVLDVPDGAMIKGLGDAVDAKTVKADLLFNGVMP